MPNTSFPRRRQCDSNLQALAVASGGRAFARHGAPSSTHNTGVTSSISTRRRRWDWGDAGEALPILILSTSTQTPAFRARHARRSCPPDRIDWNGVKSDGLRRRATPVNANGTSSTTRSRDLNITRGEATLSEAGRSGGPTIDEAGAPFANRAGA